VDFIVSVIDHEFLLNLSRGVKKRWRASPTWFSTCPFSQPAAGVQAVGSTR